MKKLFGLVVLILALGGAGALGYFAYDLSAAISAREASAEAVAAHLAADHSGDGFVNAKAYAAFDTEPHESTRADYTYRSPEGILFESYSERWQEAKLEQLYEELMRNQHGEELDYLSTVTVWGHQDENAAATHRNEEATVSIEIPYPSLPAGFSIDLKRSFGYINLYGGDVNTTVQSMARSLSHEYGHHYTFYHMFGSNSTDVRGSAYEEMRQLPAGKLIYTLDDYDYYLKNHHWALAEIAAEDYVAILGSPSARGNRSFRDAMQRLQGAAENNYNNLRAATNVYPQENIMVPLSFEVDGLAEYFCSFIGAEAKRPPESKKAIALSIEPVAKTYDNLIGGPYTFTSYRLSYNTPYTSPGVLYTLVAYSASDYYVIPIKTGGEAAIGTVVIDTGSGVSWWDDGLASGTKTFVVIATFPNGTAYKSQPLTQTF